ncbi:PHP domain-containing protein [Alteromonas sediminis]|uniref:PHP domain-containing protein n=1 Tax=Alteromonas sediminis TaxID=2259342 RepID=A0A3N5Y8X0_9ALTE|nr:PHP domain-containing protein [Alteromonas sediminis]
MDLHSHTTASDGQLTPTELMLRADTMQVDMIAITDHDTVSGIEEAEQAIVDHRLKVSLISGIELSTQWKSFGIHIVGLNLNVNEPTFLRGVAAQKAVRQNRANKIAEKLARTGFSDILPQAQALAGKGEITRAHFARALVTHHGLGTMDNAFKRFMGKGKVGDVKGEWLSIAEAVKLIHAAGGQAVLAHPLKYEMSTKWLRRLIAHFAEVNGDAVEVAGPGVSGQSQQLIHEIVASEKLKGSVGSDFHNPGRWTELGRFQQILPSVTPLWHDWPCVSVA